MFERFRRYRGKRIKEFKALEPINLDEIYKCKGHPYLVDPSPLQGPIQVNLIKHKHSYKLVFASTFHYAFQCTGKDCYNYVAINKEKFYA